MGVGHQTQMCGTSCTSDRLELQARFDGPELVSSHAQVALIPMKCEIQKHCGSAFKGPNDVVLPAQRDQNVLDSVVES